MENAGCITMDEDKYIFKCNTHTLEKSFRRSYVVLHELSHMWFGDYIIPRY